MSSPAAIAIGSFVGLGLATIIYLFWGVTKGPMGPDENAPRLRKPAHK